MNSSTKRAAEDAVATPSKNDHAGAAKRPCRKLESKTLEEPSKQERQTVLAYSADIF